MAAGIIMRVLCLDMDSKPWPCSQLGVLNIGFSRFEFVLQFRNRGWCQGALLQIRVLVRLLRALGVSHTWLFPGTLYK